MDNKAHPITQDIVRVPNLYPSNLGQRPDRLFITQNRHTGTYVHTDTPIDVPSSLVLDGYFCRYWEKEKQSPNLRNWELDPWAEWGQRDVVPSSEEREVPGGQAGVRGREQQAGARYPKPVPGTTLGSCHSPPIPVPTIDLSTKEEEDRIPFPRRFPLLIWATPETTGQDYWKPGQFDSLGSSH